MASKKNTTTNKDGEEEEIPMAEIEEDEEATIEDLPGVGPATAEKLKEAGFDDLLAIAVMSPTELAEQAERIQDLETTIEMLEHENKKADEQIQTAQKEYQKELAVAEGDLAKKDEGIKELNKILKSYPK